LKEKGEGEGEGEGEGRGRIEVWWGRCGYDMTIFFSFLFLYCVSSGFGLWKMELGSRAGNCICRNGNGNRKLERRAHGVRKEYDGYQYVCESGIN